MCKPHKHQGEPKTYKVKARVTAIKKLELHKELFE